MEIKKSSLSLLSKSAEGGLLLIVFIAPLLGGFDLWSNTLLHILTLIVLMTWLLLWNQKGELEFFKTPLDLPLAGFIILAVISAIQSVYFHSSLIALFKLINYALIYFLIVNTIREEKQIIRYLMAVLFALLIVGTYGLYEFLTRFSSGVQIRISSTFLYYWNSLAGYLVLVLPLSLVTAIGGQRRILKVLALLAFATGFFSLLLTYSRGGWLSFGLATLILMILLFSFLGFKEMRENKRWLVLILIVFLVEGAIFFSLNYTKINFPLIDHLQAIAYREKYPSTSLGERIEFYRHSLRMIGDYPLFGSGIGTYGKVFHRYKIPRRQGLVHYAYTSPYAHNEYLQIGVEMGLLGLGAFLWLVITLLGKGLRGLKKTSDKYILSGLLSGLLGILLHSGVDFVLQSLATGIIFSSFVGLTMSLGHQAKPFRFSNPKQEDLFKVRKPRAFFLQFLIVVIISALAFTVLKPYLGYYHYGRSLELLKKNKFAEAIKEAQKAIRLDRSCGSYHYHLGNIFKEIAHLAGNRRDWLDVPISQYEKAIKLDPLNPLYHQDLGWAYWEVAGKRNKELIDRAILELQTATSCDPTYANLYLLLGVIYLELERLEEALSQFKKAVALEPNYAEAHYYLGLALVKKGKVAEAIQEYREVLEIKKRIEGFIPTTPYEKGILDFNYSQAQEKLQSLESQGKLDRVGGF